MVPLEPDPTRKYDPFPLTDMQAAYWVGRGDSFDLGKVSTHFYAEVESRGLNLDRLDRAWWRLVGRHDMLRAIILPDGWQQILENAPSYRIEVLDLRDGESTEHLQAIRAGMSHEVRPGGAWPLFNIKASRLADERVRIHLSFDALTVDARSRNVLFSEWAQLYENPEASLPPLPVSFRDYVMAENLRKKTPEYEKARAYWRARVPTLPPAPELGLARTPPEIDKPRFHRLQAQLDARTWSSLKEGALQHGVRPSVMLLSSFAEILKLWSKHPRMTLNLTLFNRHAQDPRLADVVGDFTSSVLVAVANEESSTLRDRARHIQRQLNEDLKHSAVSGVEVIRDLARVGGQTRAIMPVVFTSLISTAARFSTNPLEWLGDTIYTITQTPQVWMDHQVREYAGALVFNWDVVEGLFPENVLREMFEAYVRFLNLVAADENSWSRPWREVAMQILPPSVAAFGQATSNQPIPNGLLHSAFADHSRLSPDRPAVITEQRTLTYDDLSRSSTKVARWLKERGAAPNALIGVVMEKGWEQIVAVLGILKAGAAYLPIDPGLPEERRNYLLENGEVTLVVTQPFLARALEWQSFITLLSVSEETLQGLGDEPLPSVQQSEDLAYVIYTSGSSGSPKGVMIDHRGALNTITDINRRFALGSNDRLFALSSLSFDLSAYDIFGMLAAGGTLLIPEQGAIRDPARWVQLISEHHCSVWNSVPALAELLVEYIEQQPGLWPLPLRLILLSGDWIPVGLPDRIRRIAPSAQVISLGGATEASIWSIYYPTGTIDPDWQSIPYGKPLSNQRFRILNPDLVDCPVGVSGQLHIGGVGLAKGYWRDPVKSSESFFHYPGTRERLYRTGDFGRYLADGNIEFLGRADLQVKIHGHRVELGEIEAALHGHPKVYSAVVSAIGEGIRDKRLIAYVVTIDKLPDPELSEQLRKYLSQKLPAHMVPHTFVLVNELPLTVNGKVDRHSLPPPQEPCVHPDTETNSDESALVSQFGRLVGFVLKTESIDPAASLISQGATSMDMIRIANLLERELGFRPKLGSFFQHPTVTYLVRTYCSDQLTDPSAATATLKSYPTLFDLAGREAFKNKQVGLRSVASTSKAISFGIPILGENRLKKLWERSSQREFLLNPIPFAQFGSFLDCLRQNTVDGRSKYGYGSAGGLYPVQTYIYAKPQRVKGIDAGTYYYHPARHCLVPIADDAVIEGSIYDPFINRPIFEESAFALFLVMSMRAIAPIYGSRSLHYATIEAGAMTQLLETSAMDCSIALCQVGDVEFTKIRPLFDLEEDDVLVHSLLGGLWDRSCIKAPPTDSAHRLLEKIKGLSDEEATLLLHTYRKSGSPGTMGQSPQ